MTNPLLQDDLLPAFAQIRSDHVVVALTQQIEENRQHLNSITTRINNQTCDLTWEGIVSPIVEQGDRLSRLWSPVSHMNSVVSNDDFREAHDACLPLLTEFSSEVGQNKELYEAYRALSNSKQLPPLQQKIIDDDLLDFRLAGVELSSDKQARFREIKSRLSELGSKFSNHVLDATMAWSKTLTDIADLKGMPDSAIAAAKEAFSKHADENSDQHNDENNHVVGYRLTLDIPCYLAVMTYADDVKLREEMNHAYSTRASDQQSHPEWDNTPIIQETLQLRHEFAQLLGFENYAAYSLATKMANDPQQVMDFLEQLASVSQEKAKSELQELLDFATNLDGIETLHVWDVAYYSEKLRQQKYDISQEELRPWFPEDKVLSGLFEITSRLYNVSFEEQKEVDLWHVDVRFFKIFDAKNNHTGSFYLDLYARSHKRGGAWMDSCRDRKRNTAGELQLPVAYLTCNFNAPIGDAQALFTHDEVVTLFHEFGHGLHHLMTEIDEIQVSGINGVSWDAVELPSQFMENFCYDKESLNIIARHVDTDEPLSDVVLQRLNDARQFQAAMQMVRQLEFSLFDFRIHLEFDPSIDSQFTKILREVREQVSVMPPPSWNRFENGFSHIFAGGYAAGYYSYKWAEVLSADVWSSFEEKGIFDASVARMFLDQILSQGGSKKAMELFVNFKGREPSVDALLAQQGISSH